MSWYVVKSTFLVHIGPVQWNTASMTKYTYCWTLHASHISKALRKFRLLFSANLLANSRGRFNPSFLHTVWRMWQIWNYSDYTCEWSKKLVKCLCFNVWPALIMSTSYGPYKIWRYQKVHSNVYSWTCITKSDAWPVLSLVDRHFIITCMCIKILQQPIICPQDRMVLSY